MALTLPLSCVLLLVLVEPILGASDTYNYDVSDATKGPNGWAKTWPDYCSGSSQSPIDIVASKTEHDANLGAFTLTKYDQTGDAFSVENNGHTYVVNFAPNNFLVSGGGLTGTFTLAQFHFHWGSVDTKGSEHTVDGTMYPAELHFVHFNQKYSNLSEAVKNADGLAVLGVIYKVGRVENQALTSFLKYASNVTEPTSLASLSMTHNLKSLLPSNTTDFYRYKGSLTTPTCNEVVTWTVFKEYATITNAQLNMLRGLKANNVTALTDTFRPVQALNSRVVKRSYKTAADDKKPESGSGLVTATLTTILSAAMMAAVLL